MNENQPIMIQIESLSAAYENRTVLRDVNLSIYEKDFLGIIGPNGGGKTTLITNHIVTGKQIGRAHV